MPGFSQVLRVACAIFAAMPVRAEDPHAEKATFTSKNEIKLVVAAENLAHARGVLMLEGRPAVRQLVCFFDTGNLALEANHLILRARQDDGETGESTVKIRALPDGTALSKQELAIPPEQDWTRAQSPTLSRSLDSGALKIGLVSEVVENGADVIGLFDAQQQALVTARMGNFDWSSLMRYGPVSAKVWKRELKLKGFNGRVTVEIWHLQKDGRSLDVMEVSAKIKAATEDEARGIANNFFAAAKAAGLGVPTGETKTAKVLEFYKPAL